LIRRSKLPRRTSKRIRARLPKALGTYRERVKYANHLWRRLVYKQAQDGLCVVCRKRPFVHAMHCWAKGPYPALRFDLSNGAPGCGVCHRRIDSDHHAKTEFFRPYMGETEYSRLGLLASSRAKSDLALTIMFLESETAKGAA